MRPSTLAALGISLALAGCKVSVEGAPCTSDANCPTDQRCGHSGRCSKAAVGCGEPDPVCQRSECSGANSIVCTVTQPETDCASSATTACTAAQTCSPASGLCECVDGKCAADEVCDDAKVSCAKRYVVTVDNLSPAPPVGPAGAIVTAKVLAGRAGVPPPDSLALKVDGNATAVVFAKGSAVGSETPYTGSWTPDANIQATQQLTAVATTATFGDFVSAAFGVDVDTRPPVLGVAALGCAAPPCLRDDELTVSVSVDDPHLASVEAALDLDAYGRKVPLVQGAGASWSAALKLSEWSFKKFSGAVTARAWATDALGNTTPTPAEAAVSVTRHRWTYVPAPAAPVTSPAVLPGGAAVVSLAAVTSQLRLVNADGTEGWQQTLEAAAGQGQNVTSTPSAEPDVPSGGKQAVWAASNDGRLYPRFADGTMPATAVCPVGGTVSSNPMYTPAVATTSPLDTVYSAGSQSRVRRGKQDGTCDSPGTSTTDPATTAMAMSMVGAIPNLFAATANGLTGASLRRFADETDSGGNLVEKAALGLNDGAPLLPVACNTVSVPLAMDAAGNVLAACANGQLHRVRPDFTASPGTLVTTLAFEPSESIVVLPTGDLLVPGKDNKLHRLNPATGADTWAADLKFPLGGAAVVVPDGDGVVAYATTSAGHLWALDASGNAVWSTDAAATPLGAGPLRFPTIAPALTGRLPTLLVGDGSGALHAVVVDTGLDTTSPWPKSHRDLRNTGNSSAPLP